MRSQSSKYITCSMSRTYQFYSSPRTLTDEKFYFYNTSRISCNIPVLDHGDHGRTHQHAEHSADQWKYQSQYHRAPHRDIRTDHRLVRRAPRRSYNRELRARLSSMAPIQSSQALLHHIPPPPSPMALVQGPRATPCLAERYWVPSNHARASCLGVRSPISGYGADAGAHWVGK